ncbi:bactofilin family protein [Foetidibacter luteolus]|uniref:bactofilin family protein n=1 Tax=Foetidibacter luteolus TaxID=2608880 RepID=UPI001A99FD66|nr:polymer-forming cytoskeletal protein [Foetidibacter luteolus]
MEQPNNNSLLNKLNTLKYLLFSGAGIAGSTDITGHIEASSSVTLRGRLTGSINVKGTLVIGKSAMLEGTAHADTIIVLGKVTGDLYGVQKIVVENGASVSGKTDAPSVITKNGATIEKDARAVAPLVPQYPDEEPKVTGFVFPQAPKGNAKTWF